MFFVLYCLTVSTFCIFVANITFTTLQLPVGGVVYVVCIVPGVVTVTVLAGVLKFHIIN